MTSRGYDPKEWANEKKKRRRFYATLVILLLISIGTYNVMSKDKQEQIILKEEVNHGRR